MKSKDKPRYITILKLTKNLKLISSSPRPKFILTPVLTYTITTLCLTAYLYYFFSLLPRFYKFIQIPIYLSFIFTFPFLALLDPGYVVRTEEQAREISLRQGRKLFNNTKCYDCFSLMGERNYHCEDCGICIQEFDHHCEIVGNCIGKNNEIVFELFLGVVVANMMSAFIGVLITVNLNTM